MLQVLQENTIIDCDNCK